MYLAPLTIGDSTCVPYFSSIFEAYCTYVGYHSMFFCVPYFQSIWLNSDPLITHATYADVLFFLYLICVIPKDKFREAFFKE